MGYNTVFESTECVKTTVTDTVLGSTVRIRNTVIVSTAGCINTLLVD